MEWIAVNKVFELIERCALMGCRTCQWVGINTLDPFVCAGQGWTIDQCPFRFIAKKQVSYLIKIFNYFLKYKLRNNIKLVQKLKNNWRSIKVVAFCSV